MTGLRPTVPARPQPVWRLFLHYACSAGVPKRSFQIALVVGSILNLINQGDVLFGMGTLNWSKLILTYFVPYAVSTYGVVSFRMSTDRPTDERTS